MNWLEMFHLWENQCRLETNTSPTRPRKCCICKSIVSIENIRKRKIYKYHKQKNNYPNLSIFFTVSFTIYKA